MKYASSTYLLTLYSKNSLVIQDIEFTSRQWDILSAFYCLKKPQSIGSLLGIGTKGVEAHLYNIKQKLYGKRNDLSLFLDTCSFSVREALQKHYRYLHVENAFQQMLKTIKIKIKPQGLTYEWITDKQPPQDFSISYATKHLALAGIMLSEDNQKPTFILDYQTECSDVLSYYASFIKLLTNILPTEQTKTIIQEFLKHQNDILTSIRD